MGARRSGRSAPRGRMHPDDVLRHLARAGVGPVGPVVRSGYRRRRDPFDRVLLFAGLVLAVITAVVAAPSVMGVRPRIHVVGLTDGSTVNSAALARTTAEITVEPASAAAKARVTVDGRSVPVVVLDNRVLWRPGPMAAGRHTLHIRSGTRFLWRGPARASVHFTVDDTPPPLMVDAAPRAAGVDRPATLTGTVEPGATVRAAGRAATVQGDRFTLRFPTPPVGTVTVVARDAAGNETRRSARIPLTLPMVRAVHVSALAWVTPSLREPVLAMADAGLINAVQLDIKEEDGSIGHRTSVPLANQIGAAKDRFDLRSAVEQLHARGVRVIGRVVVFRDPVLARWVVDNDRADLLVQTPKGKPYVTKYGLAFTNPASGFVRAYNVAVAREAAEAGVDDILFDYIRRPEGDLAAMTFPGLKGPVEDTVADFAHQAARGLDGTPARLGVSVFGIAARSPTMIGQSVSKLAEAVDYVAPMVYPSHWQPNFYNVKDPNGQPYDIVYASLKDFQEKLAGTGVAVVPWLQDFSLGRTYGAPEVRAQIEAAEDLGIESFMLWDPKVTYTTGVLDPIPTPVSASASGSRTP